MRKILQNKPLVEAIFELHWNLQGQAESGEDIDPDYRRFLIQMEGKVTEEYPEYKALPTADIPTKFVQHKVQHQYWSAENTWPVIQVGHGIITLNDTGGYDWSDFKKRLLSLVKLVLESHPSPNTLTLNKIQLRYINAVEFDHIKKDIFEFLSNKMSVDIDIKRVLLQDKGIGKHANALAFTTIFPTTQPKGAIEFHIKTGRRQERDVLFWELINNARGDDVPSLTEQDIGNWTEESHSLIYAIFSELIKGDLLEEFK